MNALWFNQDSIEAVASPAQNVGVRTMFLCWWAVKVTRYIHGVPRICKRQLFNGIALIPRWVWTELGGGRAHPLYFPVVTPLDCREISVFSTTHQQWCCMWHLNFFTFTFCLLICFIGSLFLIFKHGIYCNFIVFHLRYGFISKIPLASVSRFPEWSESA